MSSATMERHQAVWQDMGIPRDERRERERELRRGVARGLRGQWDAFEELPILAGMQAAQPELRRVWRNNLYCVQVYEMNSVWGQIVHLGIKRCDGEPVHSWPHFQRIKDELVGVERVAVEVYPARSQLVDDAHMYWLWVLPEGMELPFSLR